MVPIEAIQAQQAVKKTLRGRIQFCRCVLLVGVFAVLYLSTPNQPTRSGSGNAKRSLLSAEEEEQDCKPFSVPLAKQCDFIHQTQSCQDLFYSSGFVDYAVFYFCDMPVRLVAIVLMVILVCFYFLCLGVSAEDFFSPIMTGIAEEFHMSHNVAGVTLLAFANGAPDFFSSLAAFTGNKVLLGFSALYGSSAFVPVVVYGLIAILVPGFTVTRRPYLRDTVALLIVISLIYGNIQIGSFNIGTAFSVLFVYITYAAIVLIGRAIYQRMKARNANDTKYSMGSEYISNLIPEEHNVAGESDPDDLTSVEEDRFDMEVEGRKLETDLDKQEEGKQYGDFQNPFLPKSRSPSNLSRTTGNRSSLGINPLLDKYTALTEVQTHAASVLSSIPDRTQGLARRSTVYSAIASLIADETKPKNIFSRLLECASFPITWLSTITVPIPDKNHWDWRLAVLTPTTSLVFFVAAFGFVTTTVGGFPIAIIFAVVGLCISGFVYWNIRHDKNRVQFVKLFLFLGLLAAVAWVYMLANELVNLLAALGTIFGLSQAIMGLTVLAWGNSVPDAVASITVARFGYPRMGIGATLGGPIFSLAVGVGVSMLINTAKMSPFPVAKSGTLTLAFAVSAIALLLHIIVVVACKFKIPKAYAIWNLCLYAVFITLSILETSGTINVP